VASTGDHPSRASAEASLVKVSDTEWLFSFRCGKAGACWVKSSDPFAQVGEPIHTDQPNCGTCQSQTYTCADGVIRRFHDPNGNRSILACVDIDPKTLAASNERLVCDSRTINPFTDADGRVLDCFLLCPHAGGTEQYIIYGFRPKALDVPYTPTLVSNDSKDSAGVYYSKIIYTKPVAGMWRFEGN